MSSKSKYNPYKPAKSRRVRRGPRGSFAVRTLQALARQNTGRRKP